jgi:cytohesin
MLIEAGAGIDIPDTTYGTPLYAAARWGDVGLAKLLIAKGADVNAVNKYKETPLHEAVIHGDNAAAEVLIAHGADVNAKTREGQTPLDFAERMKPPAPDLLGLLRNAGGREGRELPRAE